MTDDLTTTIDIDELKFTAAYGTAVTVIGARRSDIGSHHSEPVVEGADRASPAAALEGFNSSGLLHHDSV